MSREESHSQDHFDLLPFIAILLCLIGVLMLVTMSMAALYMGQAKETWIPEPVKKDFKGPRPVLVEWDGSRATLQFEGKNQVFAAALIQIQIGDRRRSEVDFTRPLPQNELGEGCKPIADLIDWLKQNRADYYPLFAVRPSGFENFPSLREKAKEERLEVGYEPIGQFQRVQIDRQDAKTPATEKKEEKTP